MIVHINLNKNKYCTYAILAAIVLVATLVLPKSMVFGDQPKADIDGTLINSNNTIYLIQDQQLHGFTLPAVLASYGYTVSQAISASTADQALPVGAVMLPNEGSLVKDPNDPEIFLVSGQQLHPFVSLDVFSGLGYSLSSVFEISTTDLHALPVGDAITSSASAHLRGTEVVSGQTVYWIGSAGRYAYDSINVYNSWHLQNDFSKIVPANNADLLLPLAGISSPREIPSQESPMQTTPTDPSKPIATTAPKAPAINPASGSYAGSTTASITCTDPKNTVYYTIDGTTPTHASPVFTQGIPVTKSETIKAICSSSTAISGDSAVASAAYVITAQTGVYLQAPAIGSVNQLGTIVTTGSSSAANPITLLTPTIQGNNGNLTVTSTSWNSAGTQLSIQYAMGTSTVTVTLAVSNASTTGLQIQLDASQPVITAVDFGNWASSLAAQSIAVPYYTNTIGYSAGLSDYLNAWWNWHSSNATSLNGTGAQYSAKTDGTLNPLHELLNLAVSPNVDAVLPSPNNPASPYMATVAGKTFLDIWNGNFSSIQQGLANLGDYGISNCIGIIHNWQNQGYDNALPLHYPANASLGGNSVLQAAISQGESNGCLMGVHENYIDYYPNYPSFTKNDIALNSDGSKATAWFNSGTGIQSFASKPNLMVTHAQTQTPIIHQAFGTNAGFIDVNSSVPTSFDVDMDASAPQAGTQASWLNGATQLWAYERQVQQGPVFGEGNHHWYYSGLLDGVEAQTGSGVPWNAGATMPLFVDFDVMKIHPLQVNQGMGYYTRWSLNSSSALSTSDTDAYRMQEIAFGHAPFLDTSEWNNIPFAFLESNLVSPVATSYGTAQATSVQYQMNGAWVSSSVAAQHGAFTIPQVTYSNGLNVVANSSSQTLQWNGVSIPQYGWAAQGPNLLAYTGLCGSVICDYSQTPTSLFANARNQTDFQTGNGFALPSVSSLTQNGTSKSFSITYNWQVLNVPISQPDETAFVHFVDDSKVTATDPAIVFQGDYQPSIPTTQWKAGQTISSGAMNVVVPDSVPDGTYSIRIGLFDPNNGQQRVVLAGNDDGGQRYIIGYITISNNGRVITFNPAPTLGSINDPRLNSAGAVLDFGTVKTDGMFSLTQSNGMWVLRPFPRSRNFTILFNSQNYAAPSSIQAFDGVNTTTINPVTQGSYWQLPLNDSKTYSWPE
jgi:hypothetical protein